MKTELMLLLCDSLVTAVQNVTWEDTEQQVMCAGVPYLILSISYKE